MPMCFFPVRHVLSFFVLFSGADFFGYPKKTQKSYTGFRSQDAMAAIGAGAMMANQDLEIETWMTWLVAISKSEGKLSRT